MRFSWKCYSHFRFGILPFDLGHPSAFSGQVNVALGFRATNVGHFEN